MPFLHIVLKMGMENKQYKISFEVATLSQTRLQLQNFPHVFNYLQS
jgi:hypothetical protein